MSHPFHGISHPFHGMCHRLQGMGHPLLGMSHPFLGMSHRVRGMIHPLLGMAHRLLGMSHPLPAALRLPRAVAAGIVRAILRLLARPLGRHHCALHFEMGIHARRRWSLVRNRQRDDRSVGAVNSQPSAFGRMVAPRRVSRSRTQGWTTCETTSRRQNFHWQRDIFLLPIKEI